MNHHFIVRFVQQLDDQEAWLMYTVTRDKIFFGQYGRSASRLVFVLRANSKVACQSTVVFAPPRACSHKGASLPKVDA